MVSTASPAERVRLYRPWMPWVSGFVLLAGVVAALIAFNVGGIRNTAHPDNPSVSSKPATPVPVTPKTVPLAAQVRQVASAWIMASVGRADLVKSWRLTAPTLRRGFTLAQWKTGSIPVVPYPIDKLYKGLSSAPGKVEWSYSRDAMLEIVLVPGKGAGVKAQEFAIGLHRYGSGSAARWLVYYWQPKAFPARPSFSSN
jgi:hypothetical protein